MLNLKVAEKLLAPYRFNITSLTSGKECIDYIKKEFGLNENSIGSIKVLVDNSQHYSISGGRSCCGIIFVTSNRRNF